MTTTLTTLNSQLNTLLEKQASIVCNAEVFAKDLENANMKELKKIAAEWNVIPDNKTRKASYIAALHIHYEEKNGLAEVNDQIEKLQFQIKCAESQECANAQQKVIRVIRTIENEWWVGTEETFNAIYPNEGYEIHYTAHPEKPANICERCHEQVSNYLVKQGKVLCAACVKETSEPLPLTSNPSILTQDVKINGTAYTVYGCDKEELEQETLVLTEAVHRDHPLQGVTSFLSSLAIFSAHDILPLNIVGDVELYEHLKAQWDAMNGDALCRCDWCDAEPLQEQEQEELQFMEKQEKEPEILESSSLTQDSNSAKMTVWKDGEIWIESGRRTIYLSAREAYTLLDALYQHRDLLYQASQQDESEPAQKSELQQYAEKHLWEHLVESRKGILLGTGLLSWPREERITGRYGMVALFEETEEPELTDFDYMHTDSWIASSWQTGITSLTGKHGSLVAVLDGEEIELGKGIFSIEDIEGIYYVGLIPDEARELEWLSPTQLHKVDGHVINKPVELWFVEHS